MSSGDIALLILEIIGAGAAAVIVIALLFAAWVNATWGAGK